MPNAYEILGVSQAAEAEEIRAAYRRCAKGAHPDRHGGSPEATQAFLRIKAAYEVLIDPDRRAAHDRDPDGVFESQVALERRAAQKKRRRNRLRRLYE